MSAPGLSDDELVLRAIELAKAGQMEVARKLVEEVLTRDSNNYRAWVVYAQLVEEENTAIRALREALRVNPDLIRARKHLARLERERESRRRTLGVPNWLLAVLGGILALGCVAIWLHVWWRMQTQPAVAPTAQPVVALSPRECQMVIRQAMTTSDQRCQRIGSNQVCYGHITVEAELSPDAGGSFEQMGDVVGVEALRALVAAPLDPASQEWGIAIFRLQASLPRTVPGQTVTFLVYGNTELENASGDMQAIYFSTGLGSISCAQMPSDGILVRLPDGASIRLRANDADLELAGTTVLEAQPGVEMRVSLLDGSAVVRADGQEQALQPGQQVRVPLGGQDGRRAVGPPSVPAPLGQALANLACTLTGLHCPGDQVAEELPADTPLPARPTNTPAPIDPQRPTNTPVPVSPGQPTNTPVPLPTNTPVPLPTNTPIPLPTRTAATVASSTPRPGATSTPTRTPTPAPTPTRTPTPPPTNTPLPTATPTHTPPPTATYTPTHTPVPPTDTPASSCSDILVSAGPGGAEFTITNNTPSDIVITQIALSWPSELGTLTQIKLGTPAIWSGAAPGPSATIPLSGNESKRTVEVGNTELLSFRFSGESPPATGYGITISFNIGCDRSATQ